MEETFQLFMISGEQYGRPKTRDTMTSQKDQRTALVFVRNVYVQYTVIAGIEIGIMI